MEQIIRKEDFETSTQNGETVVNIYKACQYRWKDNESANPYYNDESFHINYDDALIAVNKIDMNIGFMKTIDKLSFNAEEFNSLLDYYEYNSLTKEDLTREINFFINDKKLSFDIETIHQDKEFLGQDLPEESIAVFYRHHQYLNYAYNIIKVDFTNMTDLKTEADIINLKESTSSDYVFIAENIDKLYDYFIERNHAPFNKMNKGQSLIQSFLDDNLNKKVEKQKKQFKPKL